MSILSRTQRCRRRRPARELATALPADVEKLEKREVMTAVAAPVITSPGPIADDATPTFSWTFDGPVAPQGWGSGLWETVLYDSATGQEIIRDKSTDGDLATGTEYRQWTLPNRNLLESHGQYQFFVRKDAAGSKWAKLDFTVKPKAEDVPRVPTISYVDSSTNRPTIHWYPESVSWFEFSVRDTTPGFEGEVAAGRVVGKRSYRLVNELATGHTYEVRLRSAAAAFSDWSDPHAFEVKSFATYAPAFPGILAPMFETDVAEPLLEFNYAADTTDTMFEVHIYHGDTGSLYSRTYFSVVPQNGTVQYTCPELLPGAYYELYVRAVSSNHWHADHGPWGLTAFHYRPSEPLSVVDLRKAGQHPGPVTNVVPRVTGPNGPAGARPTITWDPVPGINSYLVQLYHNGQLHVGESVANATALTPGTDLPDGDYTVHVGSVVSSGNVIWSAGHQFTVVTASVKAPPAAPNPAFSESGSNISWNAVGGAARYELLAYNKAAGRQVAHETNLNASGVRALDRSCRTIRCVEHAAGIPRPRRSAAGRPDIGRTGQRAIELDPRPRRLAVRIARL